MPGVGSGGRNPGVAHWQRPRLAFMVLSFLLVAGLTAVAIVALPLARKILGGNAANAAAAQQRHVHGQHEKTVVSLTFDDAYEDQWLYAVPLLRSNDMNATFYVITADSDGPYPCCMSWTQLRTLQGEGDDIGSHTVSHPKLTTLSTPQVTQQICGSRTDMLRNGINDPESFAYPYGSYNKANESVAACCGLTRRAAASPRPPSSQDGWWWGAEELKHLEGAGTIVGQTARARCCCPTWRAPLLLWLLTMAMGGPSPSTTFVIQLLTTMGMEPSPWPNCRWPSPEPGWHGAGHLVGACWGGGETWVLGSLSSGQGRWIAITRPLTSGSVQRLALYCGRISGLKVSLPGV